MGLKSLINYASHSKEDRTYNPEIYCGEKSLKEPSATVYGIAVSGHYVYNGIYLDDGNDQGIVKLIDIPHDGCGPDKYLENDTYQLSQVSYKHNDGTCGVAYGKSKDKGACGIINYLDPVNVGIIPAEDRSNHQKDYKKQMSDKSRQNLDDGKNTYLKDNLLNKVCIFKKCGGSGCNSFGKEKPGNHTTGKEKYKRHIASAGTGTGHYGSEYKIVKSDGDKGLDESPDNAHVGTGITSLEIVQCKLDYQSSVLPDLNGKRNDLVVFKYDKKCGCNYYRNGYYLLDPLLGRICFNIGMQNHHRSKCSKKDQKNCYYKLLVFYGTDIHYRYLLGKSFFI